MGICLEQGADLHMAQLITLPLTVSCFSKIQIGFTFLVPDEQLLLTVTVIVYIVNVYPALKGSIPSVL